MPGKVTVTDKSRSERRRYDSPLRRQQAAETRARIIAAGAELLHQYPIWNWSALTVRAVAGKAGVNERTVYRHFANEREMRDAVMEQLRDEAGVDIDGLKLEDVAEVTKRILRYAATFPIEARTPADATVADANTHQRTALLAAVTAAATGLTPADRRIVAGLLDVLWSPVSYERLVTKWGLPPEQAIHGILWAIGLVEQAVRNGTKPRRI